MQPPPRNGPPRATGPPPSGPNKFSRTRPLKHPTAMAPAAMPMTDPFAFARAPPPMAAGGPPGYASPHTEQGYLNSRGPTPSTATEPPPASFVPAPSHIYPRESGTLSTWYSMFFKDNDVENEETLAGDGDKAVNGLPGSYQHHDNTQTHSGHADVPVEYKGASPQDHLYVLYVNDGSHTPQKPPDPQYDHVENLECVPNLEVLASEAHSSPTSTAAHEVDQFKTGPNLETPDTVPRPMRSASVSSNYSKMSHWSGTGNRWHQGVVGTASKGYFEQINSSPGGDMGVRQSSPEQMLQHTPSPPKPTGIFQASANSLFEPVRSHGVGVPFGFDIVTMVAEGAASENLERPSNDMENIYGPGHVFPPGAGSHVPQLTHPVVLSHSRPSSRAFGASRPCESPATTLWAQSDPTMGPNILPAPAGPTLLAPLHEPIEDVIHPPEDDSSDLQPTSRVQPSSQQYSENLENPPKEKDAESADFQSNMGYPSSDSHSDLPVNPPASLMTAPVSNHNQPSNNELLEFSKHQSQTQNQAPGHSSSLHKSPQSRNGFYLQVTKDAQQGVRMEGNAPVQTPASSTVPQVLPAPTHAAVNKEPEPKDPPNISDPHAALLAQSYAPYIPVSGAQPSHGQYPPPYPGHVYDRYYGNYGEYPDGRQPFPGRYPPPPPPPPPPPGDPRAPQYYYDGPCRGGADPWYGRYDGQAYHDPNYQYQEPQPERPYSRTSLHSNRLSSRHFYDYHRANQSAYDYYADNSKNYDYRGNYGQYDPRYKGYYDPSYWANYDDSYRGRDNYYNQHTYPSRKEGYEDQRRYYHGYNPCSDDDYHRRRNVSGDDFGRCSVQSEQSVHSSYSHHSRQSSFSQVYRSQPDLVSAVTASTASTLEVDYYYGQYPNQADATQNCSQYLCPSESTEEDAWIAPEEPPPRSATPEKFTIPHRCARFGAGGHLFQVLPNLPSAGQPALVEIHNLETMLQNTLDQVELRAFPGPLVKEETHKVDVIKFAQNKALECSRDNNLLDRDSARLLWDFIVLLCRQNGTVVGTDITDLLLKEHQSVWLPGKSLKAANLIDFNNEPIAQAEEEPGAGLPCLLSDTSMVVPENVGKRFRELLLFGRKMDAVEAAMRGGLWGHALLLASEMDNRTHARVKMRFANSLPFNDPLQTVYQLMSGRMPASATCYGEKWGDWRPHLSMVLSNLTHTLDLDTRIITTMGDTLASKGLIDAAHFCYMTAQVDLGVFTKKSTRMVLAGSNHSLPFYQFATNEAIQRTEAYEYAQSLGSLPTFQVFKLIYACRLAEAGLSAQAFHYCEVISKTVLVQPSYYSPVLISQIIQLSEKLRLFDPQLKEKPEQELFNEPEWLIQLRQLDRQIRTGVITDTSDQTSPTQFDSSSPSDLDQPSPHEPYSMPLEVDGPTPNNPLMSSLLPGPPPQGVQLMPPAPTPPQPLPSSDVPQFYSVPPGGPDQMQIPGYPPQNPGFAPPPFQPQPDSVLYPPVHQPYCPPAHQMGSPHMPPQLPYSPMQMNPLLPQTLQNMPLFSGFIPQPISSSPPRNSCIPQMNFHDQMAHLAPGQRSCSMSSTDSPPPVPEQPSREDNNVKTKGGGGFLKWFFGKGKNEAHLPDDKNPSIVWDEQIQKWVDLNEPEEKSKLPPPPPSGFPKMAPMPGPGGPGGPAGPPSSGPPVNIFSRRASTKSRYVDVLNPAPNVQQPVESREEEQQKLNSPNSSVASQPSAASRGGVHSVPSDEVTSW